MEEKREFIERQSGNVHVTEERRTYRLQGTAKVAGDFGRDEQRRGEIHLSDSEEQHIDNTPRSPGKRVAEKVTMAADKPLRSSGAQVTESHSTEDRTPRSPRAQVASTEERDTDKQPRQTGASITQKAVHVQGKPATKKQTGAKKTLFGMLLTPLMLAALVGGLAVWYFSQMKPANMPPGPSISLPFLGYVPFLGCYPWMALAKMKETYGNIMTVRLGPLGNTMTWPYTHVTHVCTLT